MALKIDLENKVALVTGATSGIGLAIALVLAEAGCRIVACSTKDRQHPGVEQAIRSIEEKGTEVLYVQADVANPDDIAHFVKTAVAWKGHIDILVSNAGKNVFKGAQNCTVDEWQQNMDLNLRSHWLMAKSCRPFLEISGGVVIIMTSNHGFATIPGCFPYNIAKTALKGLVRSLAIEWGPKIRVVGIAPGFIDTPGNQNWFDSFPDPIAERQRTINLHPVKQLGSPEEIGGWCAFLASHYAAFTSGTTILIDGGRSALMQDE
jgi:NAD(P)-dependent dehydrogenase (short-subunit alcohol dehydrogenase family)